MGITPKNSGRIAAPRKARKDPVDMVVLAALLAVPLAYYLGLHLDWASEASATTTFPVFAGHSASPPSTLAEALKATIAASSAPNAPAPRAAAPPLTAREREAWDDMVRRLQVEAISYPGRVAIYMKDMKSNREFVYQADDLFPSASLIKLPIMAAIFQKIHSGELNLETKCALRRRHRVGGSGSLKWYRDGSQFTVLQLLDRMIDESDNTAARMLIDQVGFSYLQQQFPREGLTYTEIYPEGMSLRGTPVTYENYTTAREMASLLEKIYRGEMVDRDASAKMLDILKHLKHRARLAKGLPVGWEIAHKTGLLRGACHDTAIIFTPHGDFIMAVLTGQNRYYGRAKTFITKLGKIAYKYYKTEPGAYDGMAASAERHLAKKSSTVD